MLLAIDTSAGTSVAIVDGDGGEDSGHGTIVERSVENTRRHAEVIGTLITECLSEAGVSVRDITGVAIGMGPGPFTGLRVGIAAANAFAFGGAKPIIRVVSHDAVAFADYASGGAGPLLVTTDARRHERYWSAYSGADEFGVPRRTGGPGLAPPDAFAQEIPGYDSYRRLDTEWISAASVGMLALVLGAHGRELAGEEPLYLRSADVTLATAPKRVTP